MRLDMELSENSPLREWTDRSTNYEDTTYEWVNESENAKIRIENIDEQWKVEIFDTESNTERIDGHDILTDRKEAIAQAEDYAENYQELFDY